MLPVNGVQQKLSMVMPCSQAVLNSLVVLEQYMMPIMLIILTPTLTKVQKNLDTLQIRMHL